MVKKQTVAKRNSTPPQKKDSRKTEISQNLKAIKRQSNAGRSGTPKNRRVITKSKSAMEVAVSQQKQLLKVFDDSPIKEEDEEQLCTEVKA